MLCRAFARMPFSIPLLGWSEENGAVPANRGTPARILELSAPEYAEGTVPTAPAAVNMVGVRLGCKREKRANKLRVSTTSSGGL